MMDKFLEANAGWMITLGGLIITTIVSWVRTTDKVQSLNERLDKQDRMLEEIKSTGSPSSRLAITVLNARVEDQSSRMAVQSLRITELEKIAAIVASMATDISWIKLEMGRKMKNDV